MSNVSVSEAFAGIDEAKTEDKNPKYPASSTSVADIVEMMLIKGTNGNTFVIETQVVSSDHPEVKPGEMRSVTITDINGRWRELKLGKIKNCLAACFGINADAPEKWMEIAAMCVEKGAANGKRVRIQAGPSTKAEKSGKDYIPVVFHTYHE
jgi:hypothetical protein